MLLSDVNITHIQYQEPKAQLGSELIYSITHTFYASIYLR